MKNGKVNKNSPFGSRMTFSFNLFLHIGERKSERNLGLGGEMREISCSR
jgi:hypothetical protein